MPNFSEIFGGGAAVKSVQRGLARPVSNGYDVVVNIGAVNPSKSVVFVDAVGTEIRGAEGVGARVGGQLLNSTQIQITSFQVPLNPSEILSITAAWQVVEYY